MRVSGFSIIRNAIKYDYPIVQSIKSVLPLCDDFFIAVGQSEDDTLKLIQSIDSKKLKIIETKWDDSLRNGGKVLADETNKAFNYIPKETDWAFYIQGDEVLHEKYHSIVNKEMLRWKNNDKIDGLLFKYLHFYGSYDYVGNSENWYKNEIRIIKNNKNIYSFKDAQGFRKYNDRKLNVKSIEAYIYHYGWVKDPTIQKLKIKDFQKLWHTDQEIEKRFSFDYSQIDSLIHYKGTHPCVMKEIIASKNWTFEYDLSKNRITLKNRLKKFVKWLTGIEIGYKNYKIV